jgi:hypothetical protein
MPSANDADGKVGITGAQTYEAHVMRNASAWTNEQFMTSPSAAMIRRATSTRADL